jgi:hypothetical protein
LLKIALAGVQFGLLFAQACPAPSEIAADGAKVNPLEKAELPEPPSLIGVSKRENLK